MTEIDSLGPWRPATSQKPRGGVGRYSGGAHLKYQGQSQFVIVDPLGRNPQSIATSAATTPLAAST